MNIFDELDKFFISLQNYISYNGLFITFISLFLLAIIVVLISTSNSYEAKLIKAIDKFNHYFVENPQITEDNLLAFNKKMKSNKVPKQLRKQWQQFVLYREKKASEYMSFENCVAAPLRNSSYKRDVSTFNIVSYILAVVCFILYLYKASYEGGLVIDTTDTGILSYRLAQFFQHILICPLIILVVNYIFTIFFNNL